MITWSLRVTLREVETKHNSVTGDRPLSIRLPRSDLERLRAVAAANQRSVSGEVRFALIEHLRTQEREAA